MKTLIGINLSSKAMRIRKSVDFVASRFSSTANSEVLYSWGIGTNGQLGHGRFELTTSVLDSSYVQEEPRKMLHSKNLGTVQVGAFCSMALTDQHDLYGWGSGLVNFDGSDSRQIKEPTKLNFPASKVKSINLGSKHAAAISEDGGVYTWGEGGSWFSGGGQLGHGQNANEKAPRRISFFDDLYKEDGTRIKQVSCADRHTIFLTDDGDLLSCGLGEYGRLGNGQNIDFSLPTAVALPTSDTIITSISSGSDHSLALTSTGSILSWGRNMNGQLGHRDSYIDMYSMEGLPRAVDTDEKDVIFVQVMAGATRSLGVSKAGELFVWGNRLSHFPQMIDPSLFDEQKVLKAVIGGDGSRSAFLIVTEDGRLWSFGDGRSRLLGIKDKSSFTRESQPLVVPLFDGKHGLRVTDIFAGAGQHAFARVRLES